MRSLSAFGAVLLIALTSATVARAHGGPATDALERGWVYVPFDPTMPKSDVDRLRHVIDNARAARYPIKVAVIGAPPDLGLDYRLWRKPQEYARDLGLELRFVYSGPLLVVMPTGYGLFRRGKSTPEIRALRGLPVGHGTNGLTRSAVEAVASLARAAGHPVAVPQIKTTSSGLSDRVFIIIGAAVLAVAFTALELRRRAHQTA